MADEIPKIDPRKTALLIMDYQQGIVAMHGDGDTLLERAEQAIATAREHGVTVGYVRVAMTNEEVAAVPKTNKMIERISSSGRQFGSDAPDTQVVERLAPKAGDIVVRKIRVGAFSTTDLANQLKAKEIDTLILAGISTSGVVLSTVRDAADHDYQLFVLSDACADSDAEVHRVLLEKVFPRQADVITVDELADLLKSSR